MNQNYIKIFENNGGGITVKYGSPNDDEDQSMNIDMISFAIEDLAEIGHHLIHLHEELSEG